MIKINSQFKEKIQLSGNLYGKIKLNNKSYFYKIVDKNTSKLEIKGYQSMKSYYPVAKLCGTCALTKNKNILIYLHENTINNESGLLVDLFAQEKKFNKHFLDIINLYKQIFNITIKKNKVICCDVFFKNRIRSRLEKFYDDKFIDEIDGAKMSINDFSVQINLRKIKNNIKSFFNNHKNTWCVISQCDPNDLNIGTKPIILDYVAGGLNPLMAEFATLYWYQLAQGSYLSLKYNKKAFIKHKQIYSKACVVKHKNNKIEHYSSMLRKEFTSNYIKKVIAPLIDKYNFTNWYYEFKNYLAMKILCVFDLNRMSKKDRLLSLGYLQVFYNLDITNPKELISYFIINSNEHK